MDVKQLIVGFLVWKMSTILKVQCNVTKIYFFKIFLNVNIKNYVFENLDDSFSLFAPLLVIKVS